MFFDNHTMRACPDVGHDFSAEDFAGNLKEAGVDLVGFHAKCNQGFCYYRTKTGIRHPSLPEKLDMFGDVVKECGKRGIRVSAYLNCGLSYEDALRHPEWCRISPKGEIQTPGIYDIGQVTPYMRTMCPNSPWRDYLLGLIREVRDQYPVAGFLLDSFNPFPCVCPHCIQKMKAENLDPAKNEDVEAFAKKSVLRLATDISNLLEPRKKGLLVYFLGISPRDNARIGTYLECECIPTNPGWGYDRLPIVSRYFRNITKGPVMNMTGRFYTWGDFGTLRSEAAIEYDLFYGLANGMRPNIGDHLLPSGKISAGVADRVKRIFKNVQKYRKWHDAEPVTEIGVVFDGSAKNPAQVGATRLLSELKMQFDFVDPLCDWSRYKLLVFPQKISWNESLMSKIRAHISAGKSIFAAGDALFDDKNNMPLAKDFGIRINAPCPCDPAYFRMDSPFDENMPDMPQFAGSGGWNIAARKGTRIAAHVVSPYYNRHWDGMYSYFYTPPHKDQDLPFITLRNNQFAFCSFPVFDLYFRSASCDLKQAFANVLAVLLPDPLLCVGKDSFPSFGRAFVTKKKDSRIVHLLNYVPELRGEMLIIEEGIPAHEVFVSLRNDAERPEKVILQPAGKELPFRCRNGRTEFRVPSMKGYALIEIC